MAPMRPALRRPRPVSTPRQGLVPIASLLGLLACSKPDATPPPGAGTGGGSGTGAAPVAPATKVRVAAAADLGPALVELGRTFTAATGIEVVADTGSTGLLAKQIEGGREVDLFAAADVSYVDKVVAAGACDGASKKLYGRGQLVMWVASGGVAAPTGLADLTDARFKKIAIANPDHAPYGRAARAALTKVGVYDQLTSRLVLGENVRATLQYAQTGNVEVAIVARSLALATEGGVSVDVPADTHPPLDQALVVCGRGAGAAAGQKFADHIASAEGRAVLARFGFAPPGP